MKKIITIFFLFPIFCSATNYYFANNGDDSRSSVQASNPATPWATLTKLSQFFTSLNAGDSVLFRRGDTFYGSIVATKSGNSGANINFGAYGAGAKPIITGFTNVNSWTNVSGNIWESSSAVKTTSDMLNMVTVNGSFQDIGRYPKVNSATTSWSSGGYYQFQSHSGTSSITSNQIAASSSFVGGQLVIRSNHYLLNKGIISAQTSTTVSYTPITTFTVSPIYEPIDNYGFFFQNHINACVQTGDWYYNTSTKKVGIYSSGTPSGIQIASIDTLINLTSRSYLSFSNVDFTGGNNFGFLLTGSSNISIYNSNISFCGVYSLYSANSSANHLFVSNCNLSYANDCAIFASSSTNWTIQNCNISYIGNVAGMGVSADGSHYSGTANLGVGSLVQYNSISETGLTAIHFSGSITVQNNFVSDFCTILDDGAGIGCNSNSAYKTIQNNIVINGIGAPNGTPNGIGGGAANGIYIDDYSSNASILNNTVANCQQIGIKIHNSSNITISGNTAYNNGLDNYDGRQIFIDQDDTIVNIRNISATNNIYFSLTDAQIGLSLYSLKGNADVLNFGIYDSNYYCYTLVSNAVVVGVGGTDYYTLSQWQSYSSQDAHSKKSPKTVTDTSQIKFYYNETNVAKTFSLGAVYIDVYGTPYLGSITLQPYTSAVLLFSSSNLPNPLSATITQNSPILCYGNTTSLSAQGVGGAPPYTYLWSTGATTRNISSVGANNYSVQITDAANVIANQSILVIQPTAVTVNVAFGFAPTTVSAIASGGVGSFTYKLDAGSYQSSNIFLAVAAGNHTMTAKDANGCTSTTINFTVIPSGVPLAITASSSNPDCYGGNGSVTIGASGGTSPYTGTGVFAQAAGTVTYTVTDNVGAKHDTTITLTNPPIITIVQITLDSSISVYGRTTRIYIAATGGTGSLQYKLDGGSYQSADSFSAVSAGNHIITVKDDNSCTQAQTFTLTQPSPTPSSYFILRRRKFKNG